MAQGLFMFTGLTKSPCEMVFAWATSAAKWINKATAGSRVSSGLEIFQLLKYNWQFHDVEAS